MRPHPLRAAANPTLCVLALALAAPASGHDLWLVADPPAVAAGDPLHLRAATGMAFPRSESAVATDRIEAFWVMDSNGQRHDVKGARVDGTVLRAEALLEDPGVVLAALAIKPRILELSAEDFNDYLDHDGLPQILEQRRSRGEMGQAVRESYAKFAKAIVRVGEGGPGELATRPAGLRIEIVPLRDPARLEAGQQLPVQVMFEGRPLEGVYVYALAEGEQEYVNGRRTDSEGRASVRLTADGLMSLHCIHMRPHADPSQADWESFFATVTFVVGEP